MKSFALNLIRILFLGALHIKTYRHFRLFVATVILTASVSIASSVATAETTTAIALIKIQSTTAQPAALLASTPTTMLTTKSRRWQAELPTRQALAYDHHQRYRNDSSPSASSLSSTPPSSWNATTFASMRLMRNAPTITASTVASGMRQNRSLQSASTIAQQRNSDSSLTNMHKYKRYDRPHHLRTSYNMSTRPTLRSSSSSLPETTFNTNHYRKSIRHSTLVHNDDDDDDGTYNDDDHGSKLAINLLQTNSSTKTKLQQTPKTPRMIQRLVAGHIQNAEGHSTYQVSVVTTNSSISNSSTTVRPSSLYFRRKKQPMLSSSYRESERVSNASVVTTTTESVDIVDDEDDREDDEALLDDAGDFDNWDNGILRLSAGSGKESFVKSKKNTSKDDSKKTLSDQVREGKYGLIEKEIFRREPKRPGVLSYLPNKEVPIDNERNYGGLSEDEIWLAEDHLLVIKGGSLNVDKADEPWPPIDDYDAPGRQIKIPPNPKVPPPFPVQLEENGPVQFIGNNKFTVVFPVANESIPVYPAGPEANYTPSESDSDNEKNSLARPGSPQDSTEEPGYVYPAPYPPWLYHNQTFVNPFLSNARPITFPGLGPFPFGRNGSLDNSNGTDYFDEDDPSLYYPPSYSFVYKSNYSNPVPPGPLVPGIVLPPPANQFSRLEKSEKPATSSFPPKLRSHPSTTSTTSSPKTTTTTTTTTSTTTEAPYRQHQVITTISEYTPKTIDITPAPPRSLAMIPISKPTPPPIQSSGLPLQVEPVPVPVAVPVPIYPSNSRPNAIDYVPTTRAPSIADTLSNSNPIYYDYAQPKRKPATTNIIDDFLSTTSTPATPVTPAIRIYTTSKRPLKPQPNRNYLRPIPPNRQFVQPENIVYITPKPEIRYKMLQQRPIYNARPLHDFEQEVNAIRDTLRYYHDQQLRDNSIPRTPKAKTVYEYTFDATKNLQPLQQLAIADVDKFQPPSKFDEQPFKPMVTYSPHVDDENVFKAIAYDKVDNDTPQSAHRDQQNLQQHQQQTEKYHSTSTLVPLHSAELEQYKRLEGRPKKIRLKSNNLQQQQQQQQQPFGIAYQSTPRTVLTTSSPSPLWTDKQEFNEYATQRQQRLQQPNMRTFSGYYYEPPPGRQNNRFYDEPFQNGGRKVVNYRPQPSHPYPQQDQFRAPIWSLENDTNVNYAPNRPPLNPDAEFIDPYLTIPVNPYANSNQGQRLPLPPPISHQSQYYASSPPTRRFPPLHHQHTQHQQEQQQQQQIPLHRDILVNYRQPLPPINPDSEFISPVVSNPIYRSNPYRGGGGVSDVSVVGNDGEQSNIYYITPKYRRSNNNNNNNKYNYINANENQGIDNKGN